MPAVRRQISEHASKLRRDRTDAEEKFWQAVHDGQIDGGQHSEEREAERTAFLEPEGFEILRFRNTTCWQTWMESSRSYVKRCTGGLKKNKKTSPSHRSAAGPFLSRKRERVA